MKFYIMGLSALLVMGAPVDAAEMIEAKAVPSQVSQQADAFFALLDQGNADKAVGDVIASSPLWPSRTGVKEQLMAQIDAAAKIYGPVVTHELVSSEKVGTMLIRQYWMVQHRDAITRWEFDFMRTGAGWKVAYFGFTDQAQNWF